jgi:hypothetical protein
MGEIDEEGALLALVQDAVTNACWRYHDGFYGKVATRPDRRDEAIADGVARILEIIARQKPA